MDFCNCNGVVSGLLVNPSPRTGMCVNPPVVLILYLHSIASAF